MSDEAQADVTASTPTEATKYEPLGETVSGSMHASSEVPEVPADSEHVAAANPDWVQDKAEQEQDNKVAAQQDWQTTRPPFILSFVESDHPQGGFVIGWDTCGSCNMHLRTCKCVNGPVQPEYVRRWRPADDTDHDKPKPPTPAVRKAIVAADAQAVENAVDEALGGPTTTRKRRSDAGQPRGPRKKADATPDSVAEAAGDLAGAMSKE